MPPWESRLVTLAGLAALSAGSDALLGSYPPLVAPNREDGWPVSSGPIPPVIAFGDGAGGRAATRMGSARRARGVGGSSSPGDVPALRDRRAVPWGEGPGGGLDAQVPDRSGFVADPRGLCARGGGSATRRTVAGGRPVRGGEPRGEGIRNAHGGNVVPVLRAVQERAQKEPRRVRARHRERTGAGVGPLRGGLV